MYKWYLTTFQVGQTFTKPNL